MAQSLHIGLVLDPLPSYLLVSVPVPSMYFDHKVLTKWDPPSDLLHFPEFIVKWGVASGEEPRKAATMKKIS